MKKWAWLLVFPYVVTVSTRSQICLIGATSGDPTSGWITNCDKTTYSVDGFSCDGDAERCEYLYDLAEAMNEAHERRTVIPLCDNAGTFGPCTELIQSSTGPFR